jgi:hypothetical protein
VHNSRGGSNHRIDDKLDLFGDQLNQNTRFTPFRGFRVRRIAFAVPQREYKGYVKFVELHIRAGSIKEPTADFCVMFEFPIIGADSRLPTVGGSWGTEVNLCIPQSGKCEPKQFVLIPIVKISKNGKERRDGWIRSIVRLRSLDCCPRRTIQDCNSPARVLEVDSTIRDGEGEALFLGGRKWTRQQLMNGNGIDQVVERGPQIVKAIRDHERPSRKRRLFTHLKSNAPVGRIFVSLSNESVRFSLYPRSKLSAIGCKVLFGSGEPSIDAAQI